MSRATFNRHFAKARRLQAMMALNSGHIEWRNWRGISHKFITMFLGQHRQKKRPQPAAEIDQQLELPDAELRLPQFIEITSKPRHELMRHPVYNSLDDVANLRLFMESHVFAVWDFMTILKTLQQRLTVTTTPWLPPLDPHAARLINDIVLEEESDRVEDGVYLSHFELYRAAMREIGADRTQIDDFIARLRGGATVAQALARLAIPSTTKAFVLDTMEIQHAKTHEVVACFLMGRESVIPDMFRRFLETLEESQRGSFRMMKTYLERHIDLDEESHAPMGRELMKRICGADPVKWSEAARITCHSLEMRRTLWDGVVAQIRTRRPPTGAKRSPCV